MRKSGTVFANMRRLMSLAVLAVSAVGFSQANLGAPGQYFQFRKMSGLSGSGFGVTIDGQPSIMGAMAFSTPIAYSLGGGIFQVGLGARSVDNQPRFINTNSSSKNHSSSDAEMMAGIGTGIGNFTFGYEAVSYERDTVFHLEYQLPIKSKNLGVAVGSQDITNRREGGAISSRTFYAVATYEYKPGDHVSVGYGDARFRGPFMNTDYLINNKLKATFEYDTFEFNPGLAYSFGKVKGLPKFFDHNETTLFLGYLQFKYATVALNVAF